MTPASVLRGGDDSAPSRDQGARREGRRGLVGEARESVRCRGGGVRAPRTALEAITQAGCGTSVILDGSFVMACVDEPDDIDLILILPPDWLVAVLSAR